MFFLSTMASLGLVLGAYAVAKGKHQIAGACGLTAAATVLALFLGWPAFVLHSLGSFLLAVCCAALRGGPKAVLTTSVVAMLASYGLVLWGGANQLRHGRFNSPVGSLVDRLAYEDQRAALPSAPPVLAAVVEQRLRDFENDRDHRIRSLESLHHRIRDDFVRAQGNGRSRVPRNLKQIRIELPPVRLPAPAELDDYDSSSHNPPQLALLQSIERAIPAHSRLLRLHDDGLEDFLNHNRMGYFQDREHVAEFTPHRFLRVPRMDDAPANQWQIARLELVSLLKHETPVVYVAEHLPQMDKLKHAPTRPLSYFEQTSLQRLQSDEDLVAEEGPDRIRMLGSIRAAKSCLECHSVERGELLGAFSYELAPHGPRPPKVDVDQPAE